MKFRLSWFFLLLNFLLNSVRKSLNSFQLFFFCSKRVIKVAFSDMFFWLTSFWFSKNIEFWRLPHCVVDSKRREKMAGTQPRARWFTRPNVIGQSHGPWQYKFLSKNVIGYRDLPSHFNNVLYTSFHSYFTDTLLWGYLPGLGSLEGNCSMFQPSVNLINRLKA